MSVGPTLENCTDCGDACLINEQVSSLCYDCDGLGSVVGGLPCGRCAGSGIDPTSAKASEVHQGVRPDFGATWNLRSPEWLSSGLRLRTIPRGESP